MCESNQMKKVMNQILVDYTATSPLSDNIKNSKNTKKRKTAITY